MLKMSTAKSEILRSPVSKLSSFFAYLQLLNGISIEPTAKKKMFHAEPERTKLLKFFFCRILWS